MTPTSSPSAIAGRYRLGAPLGRGGMGEVWEATDLRLARPVAIKLLRADLAHQPDLRRRFEREARAAARLTHPNVVAVFDTGEYEGVPYIVMERLSGVTLADELVRGPLGGPDACAVATEVLSALDAAHRIGILHRDIKPGNILRSDHGHVKVADFGIAKVTEDTDRGTTEVVFGTVVYLAPERLAGAPATPASDLYSLGVVLFEALAGRVPFRADSPLGLVRAVTEETPPSLAALRPDVDAALVAVVERAMARDPARRFASAAAMAAAITATTVASRTTADHPTVPVAARRPEPRAGTRPAPTEVLPPATREAPPSPPSPGRRRVRPVAVITAALVVVIAAVLVVALLVAPDDTGPARPAPARPTSGPTIPRPLRHAIDDLDRTVRP